MKYKVQGFVFSVIMLSLFGCNSGGSGSNSPTPSSVTKESSVVNLSGLNKDHQLLVSAYALGSSKLTSAEYAKKLLSINSSDAQKIGSYYAKIKPLKTIYESQVVIDCIPFDQQQGIIDLPKEQKDLANKYNDEHFAANMSVLQKPENKNLLLRLTANSDEKCLINLIPQARPSLDPKTLQRIPPLISQQNNLTTDNSIYNWMQRLPSPGYYNSYVSTGDIFTRQPIPGTQSPYVYHDSFVGAPTQNCNVEGGCTIISQIWVVGDGNTLELGTMSYWSSRYSLFARSVKNHGQYGPDEAPFVQWSGTPYPANVFNSGDGADDLHYIISNKGASDPMCAGDPAGCYVFMVGHSDHGRSNTSLFEMGYFSKSNYNQQNFNMFATGVETHQLVGETVYFGDGVYEQRMGLNYGDKTTVPYGVDLSEQYYGYPSPNNLQFTYTPDYYGTPMVMRITGFLSR